LPLLAKLLAYLSQRLDEAVGVLGCAHGDADVVAKPLRVEVADEHAAPAQPLAHRLPAAPAQPAEHEVRLRGVWQNPAEPAQRLGHALALAGDAAGALVQL